MRVNLGLIQDCGRKKSPNTLRFPSGTLGQLFDEQVKAIPNEKAIWFLDTFVTYKELSQYVDAFATALAQRGIKKGDVVTILLPNCIQYVVCYYGIIKIGAIASLINPTYKSLEVLHQLDEVGSKVLVVLDFAYKEQVCPHYRQAQDRFINLHECS